ncbi:hypothetical protein XENTR_v10004274 [Xenopus tropicalis]|nr:hypothetical protein XENTR_v10004274 [Xenopus tropicalis]
MHVFYARAAVMLLQRDFSGSNIRTDFWKCIFFKLYTSNYWLSMCCVAVGQPNPSGSFWSLPSFVPSLVNVQNYPTLSKCHCSYTQFKFRHWFPWCSEATDHYDLAPKLALN